MNTKIALFSPLFLKNNFDRNYNNNNFFNLNSLMYSKFHNTAIALSWSELYKSKSLRNYNHYFFFDFCSGKKFLSTENLNNRYQRRLDNNTKEQANLKQSK